MTASSIVILRNHGMLLDFTLYLLGRCCLDLFPLRAWLLILHLVFIIHHWINYCVSKVVFFSIILSSSWFFVVYWILWNIIYLFILWHAAFSILRWWILKYDIFSTHCSISTLNPLSSLNIEWILSRIKWLCYFSVTSDSSQLRVCLLLFGLASH